jgi:hypothetical protein
MHWQVEDGARDHQRPCGRVIASARRRTLARDAQAAQRIELLRTQPTTSAACWLCPSLMPRAFIQS